MMNPSTANRVLEWSGKLSVRVTLALAASLVLFAGLVLFGTIREAETTLLSHLSTRADDLSELVAELAASEIADLEAFKLEILLEDVARQRDVQQINVVDITGSIIADGQSETGLFLKQSESALVHKVLASGVREVKLNSDSIDLAVPVKLGRKLVGVLHITMTLDAIATAVDRVKLNYSLLVAGCLALVLPIAAFLSARTTHSIRRMTVAVKGVTHGNLSVDFSRSTTGEVGELQRAFQRMLTDLKDGLVEIERLAFTDLLTDLPNRRAFRKAMENALAQPGSGGSAILFLDLDGFKHVNDTLGHDSGDELLKQVSARLLAALAKEDMRESCGPPFLARLGGDEFIVLLAQVRSELDGQTIAEGLIEALDLPFLLRDQEVGVSASIGVTLAPRDGGSYDQLLKCADLAMYKAKAEGRGVVREYTPDLALDATRRAVIENELRDALVKSELVVHYQPQISCSSHRIIGAEALVRWQHPTKGLLAPSAFLAVAEETGLIDEIGWYVLKQAARDGAVLARNGFPISISVNISASQFEITTFTDQVLDALREAGLPPHLLELELTESIAMKNPAKAISRLQPLRDLGVRFAIDDFGTGYSSLSYLARLPIDTVKIDGSFIRAIGTSSNADAIVTIILHMAKSLNLRSIAEGIETETDFDFVRRHGVDVAQGFLFSRALRLEDFSTFLMGFRGGSRVEDPSIGVKRGSSLKVVA